MLTRITREEAETLTAGVEPRIVADYQRSKAYCWNLPNDREVSYTYYVDEEGRIIADNYHLIDRTSAPGIPE